ncbi:hypothetical protein ACVWXM_006235 [Bradyrhizobium sp. GM7.3]
MSTLLSRLSTRYKVAEDRVEAAEAEVRRASAGRLAELMKLPPRQRLQRIDDPILTTQDRLKLRRSIEVRLPQSRRIKIPFASASFRRSKRWVRSAPTLVILIAACALPSLLAYRAWKNTDEIIPLYAPLALDWTLPDGSHEPKVMPAGGNLAIRPFTSTSAIARRWILGKGYATAEVFW